MNQNFPDSGNELHRSGPNITYRARRAKAASPMLARRAASMPGAGASSSTFLMRL